MSCYSYDNKILNSEFDRGSISSNYAGIYIYGGYNYEIKNNEITKYNYGIYIYYDTYGSLYYNNSIHNNTNYGIYMQNSGSSSYSSDPLIFEKNSLVDNYYGFYKGDTSSSYGRYVQFKDNLVKTKNITIDSKSGYSGAGRGVHKKYKDKNLYESLSAYGVGFHRHNSEIEQMLKKFTKKELNFHFTPHLSPMFRGILSTIYIDLEKDITQSKVIKKLSDFYKKDHFVKILMPDSLISTNDVIGTNNCFISVCKSKYKNKLIILSAIDNLIKGGAGQAIQNLNMKFNFPLKTAL